MPDASPLSASVLQRYADPAYLSKTAPASEPARGPNWMHRVGLPAIVGGQAADVGTTLAALGRGAVETNPVYGAHPSAGRLIGTQAAIMAPLALLLDRAYDKSPPKSMARKMALLAALGVAGMGVQQGVRNSQTGRK